MRLRQLAALVVLFGGSMWACAEGNGNTPLDGGDEGAADNVGDFESDAEDGPDVRPDDAGDAEAEADACEPTGDELCDGVDNDCDGETDEGFELSTDPDNCGACNAVCRPEHATGGCADGDCTYACDDGWVDVNGSPVDGCEYECTATATAETDADGTCDDGVDNDCDGRSDDGDADCTPCPPESCNGLDDDCDGLTDEDFDVDFDPENCGACGNVCPGRDHAVAACVVGSCEIRCEAGWADLDGNVANGCEAACVPVGTPNEARCDGRDDDCDGSTDEDFVGTECGESLCRRSSVCWRGTELACTPRDPPAPVDVTCDGIDDDCDGSTDEDTTCACIEDGDCNDGIDCTIDTCIRGEGRCEHASDPVSCSDGDVCSGEEICDVVLGCIAGTPIDCSDGIGCTDDICNPLSGACSWSPNHTRCTGTEICDPPRSSVPTGCAPAPTCVTDPDCDDGDRCNGIETCGTLRLCEAGTPVDCDDGVACTADACNPLDGACSHTPPDVDGDTYADAACSGTDCEDRDPLVHPGAIDACNGADDNCDTVTDGGAVCSAMPHADTATCVGGQCSPNCNLNWGDCDGILSNGCDTQLTTLLNCGACGVPCDLARASESCSTGICRISSCDTPWGDCNSSDADGCEATLTTLTNCGACGVPCSPANATGATCITGACAFSGCVGGWGNCNGSGSDGCERSLTTLTDCGSCGVACDLANATESCTTGSCALIACSPTWGNCDGSTTNGCETSLTTLSNCGTCGSACDLSNASESCSTGSCVLLSCSPNWGNCNGTVSDGCEASLTSLTNCGVCGTPCSPANVTGPTCAAGSCSFASCNSGYGNCDGNAPNGCEASLRTLTDCGSCGVPCDLANATESCSTGSCTLTSCSSGYGNCDGSTANGCEASLTSLANCGSCGTACSPANVSGPTCSTGSCSYASCNSGYGNCDGSTPNGCETSLRTLTDCGTCGTACSLANATESCSTGTCTLTACSSGYGNCNGLTADGCEVALTTLTNCGSCGTVCAPANATGPTCSTGSCSYASCSAGYGNCDGSTPNGCETSLRTLTDCGTCGTTCDLANASESCSTGSCALVSCVSGYGNCDGSTPNGCEAALTTLTNCGSCGTACSLANASESCSTGSCALVSCDSGYGNCNGTTADGCEASLTTLTNCGSCGTACSLANATESCSTGSCAITSCDSGYGNCNGTTADGCEASLRTLSNCGSCGTTCALANATESCSTGSCLITTCDSGYANCDGSQANGCETPINTLTNCGGCGVACDLANASESCATGTCTLGTCNTGYGNCDGISSNGCEASLYTLSNCGGCGALCDLANASESCPTGTCTLGSCNSGYGNCDGISSTGCEAALNTLTNCGGCGIACNLANASETCATGTCALVACNSGYANCDGVTSNGCETPINTLTNCGGCGVICDLANASESCATGTCTLTACLAGWANVDGISTNGCECAMESPEAGATCATAYNLGSFSDSPTSDQSVTGKITDAGDVDCFTFTASDSSDTTCDVFHVDVRFTSNPSNQFQFNVYRGGCVTVDCASSIDSYSWYTDFTSGSMTTKVGECGCRTVSTYDYNLCTNNGGTYTFCVSRRGGFPLTCDAYTIRVTNGVF